MLLLTTTARERAWRLLKIHSQFFDYVFLELSRAFTFVWTLLSPYIRSHKPTETFIFAQAWLCWSSNLRRYRAISDQLLSGDHAARKAFGAHVSENLHRDQVFAAVCAPFESSSAVFAQRFTHPLWNVFKKNCCGLRCWPLGIWVEWGSGFRASRSPLFRKSSFVVG